MASRGGGFLPFCLSFFDKISPLLGALAIGISLSALFGGFAERKLAPLVSEAKIQSALAPSSALTEEEDLSASKAQDRRTLIQKNPFGLALLKHEIKEDLLDEPALEERVFSVDGIKVVGSLPSAAAWLREGDKVTLVLVGQVYEGFTLKEILPYSVILSKDNVNYQVYISYKDEGLEASSVTPRAPSSPSPSESKTQITPASEGTEGAVARELVDSLLMNPLEELKKVRLIPKFEDGNPVGIEVANVMEGSLLGELGVQKGDVIRSVNGVVIRNMGDVANAINSLMGGSRFEVAVGRGDSEVMLNYVVK